jgi:hypothetical protein
LRRRTVVNSPTPHPIVAPEITFNREQMLTLSALCDLYQDQHGFFTQRQLGRLRFVRRLCRTDGLTDGQERKQKVA